MRMLGLVGAAMAVLGAVACTAADTRNGTRGWRPFAAVESLMQSTNRVWNGDSLCLSNQEHTARFFTGRRRCEINGASIWLHAPFEPGGESNDWRLGEADLAGILLPILAPTSAPPVLRTVMLDPGHGGEDTGAFSQSVEICERQFTFALALRVSNVLARAAVTSVLTRCADRFVSLDERTQLASNAQASVFVSLHANHAANTDACGIETYALPFAGWPGTGNGLRADPFCEGNRFDAENTRLGFAIHSRVAPLGLSDRGFKRARFAVLRHAPCPAVLLECGFLSHTNDALMLADPAYCDRLAAAIAEGILAYGALQAPPPALPPLPPPPPPQPTPPPGDTSTPNLTRD